MGWIFWEGGRVIRTSGWYFEQHDCSAVKSLSVPPGGIASKPACDKRVLKYIFLLLREDKILFLDIAFEVGLKIHPNDKVE